MPLSESTFTEIWQNIQVFLSNPLYLGLGGGLILACFLLILLLRRPPKAIRSFSDETGEVLISTKALTDLVKASCTQLEGVSKPKIRLIHKRGNISLDLRLRLESGARIRLIREALKNHLRVTLQNNLGFENLGEITVLIENYKVGNLATLPSLRSTQPHATGTPAASTLPAAASTATATAAAAQSSEADREADPQPAPAPEAVVEPDPDPQPGIEPESSPDPEPLDEEPFPEEEPPTSGPDKDSFEPDAEADHPGEPVEPSFDDDEFEDDPFEKSLQESAPEEEPDPEKLPSTQRGESDKN